MSAIIEVKNLGKKYTIGERQGYIAMRDVLTNIVKSPARWFGSKVKTAVGQTKTDDFWALQDINFTVEQGEVLGIIGRNGAGKSTLLKILSQITPPTTGEIKLRGRVGSLLEVGTGFHPELTGRENIYLNGAILGMRKKEIEKKFDEIVEFAGIGKFLDTPVKRYSSGMYVRLAFAVAAHLEPDILIIDEVLAVGDAEFQKKCLGKMEEVTKQGGRTVLFVSHNMGAIQKLCPRSLLINAGRIAAMGKTEEVLQTYLQTTAGESEVSLNHRVNRKGSGKIIFTSIYFKDENGKDTNFFQVGQNIEIWLSYAVHDPQLKEFDVGISFDTFFDQNRIAAAGNRFTGQKIKVGAGLIKLRINHLSLNCGRYQFTIIAAGLGNEVFDWVQKAGEFEVVWGDFYGSGQLPSPTEGGAMLLDYSFIQ